MKVMKFRINIIFAIVLCFALSNEVVAQDDPNAPAVDKAALRVQAEEDYYAIRTIPVPEDVLVEGGGVAVLPDGTVAVATRRGDVWIIDNIQGAEGRAPHYRLFASGLHEPLGCVYKDGSIYAAQRGELTRLQDTDGDGYCDVYETIYAWPLSGHYHEYSFGPVLGEDGSFYVKEPIRKALSEKLIGVVQQAFLPILNSRKPLYMIFIKSHTYNLSFHSRRNKIGQHIKNQRVVLFID